MARQRKYRVEVDIGGAATIPARITAAQRRLIREASQGLAKVVGEESRSSQIASATAATPSIGDDTALVAIGVGVPFARIRDTGGTIEPRPGNRVLRFADGSFRPRARQKGIRYMQAAANRWSAIAREEFHACFDRI